MKISEQYPGIYSINDSLATRNLRPGLMVYREKLFEEDGQEYRLWDPHRSKLAATILNGLETFSFKANSQVLYLGASAGTTPSHISDIVKEGVVYCVEFSPRMMRKLLEVCRSRMNMIPILDDATRPENYLPLVQKVDVLYCDVAQPRQSKLFMDNMRLFLKEDGIGIIMLKARSIDVTKRPRDVFKEEVSKIKTGGFKVIEKVKLEPYEKDHMALVCEFSF